MSLNYFLPEGEDTRNGTHFRLVDHDGDTNVIKTKIIKRGLIEKLRIKSKTFAPEKHFERWLKIYKSPHPVSKLYVEGFLTIINNIPRLIKFVYK